MEELQEVDEQELAQVGAEQEGASRGEPIVTEGGAPGTTEKWLAQRCGELREERDGLQRQLEQLRQNQGARSAWVEHVALLNNELRQLERPLLNRELLENSAMNLGLAQEELDLALSRLVQARQN
jgi:hypothetical protein